MKAYGKNTLVLVSLLAAFLGGCSLRPETTTESQIEVEGYIRPTETLRVWATIAPDNVATPSPTPTMRPISVQVNGRIAFQSDRDGSLEIYVMNADGSAVSRLTNNPAVDVFPAWSPDGDRIAFTSDRDGYPDIYMVNPDGTDLRKLTNSAANDVLPTWSADGNRIAFVSGRDGNDEIYTMRTDGTDLVRLTDDSASDLFPDWSPDGNWIVFSTNRDVNSEIYKMRNNGSELTRLTDDPAADSNPAWSPDGKQIAFISRRDGFSNLFVMNIDGSNPTQLTFYKSIVEVPSWSPDSRVIAFSSDMEGNRNIFIISSDGSSLNHLTNLQTEDFYPAWSPLISFLDVPVAAPTAAPEGVCVNSGQADYGYSKDNPIRIGYDPRGSHETELTQEYAGECLPWLLGPQGQPIQTTLLEEIRANDTLLCKVAVSYAGQDTPDIMYFDIFNYEQPKAPQGYTCGSPIEYLKAITAAIY